MIPTEDAARITNVSYRQLDHWITKGYIQLTDPNPGTGNYRYLSPAQFAVLTRMSQLVAIGVRPELAAKYARALRLEGKVTLGNLTITEGGEAA